MGFYKARLSGQPLACSKIILEKKHNFYKPFTNEYAMSRKYDEFEAMNREVYEGQFARRLGELATPLIILLVLGVIGKQMFGLKQPGALLERASYDAKVYVLVFPDNKSSKNYYLPAEISRNNGYSLDTLYWPNGGTTDFTDSNCVLYLNLKASCGDGNDNDYEIELTSNLAK